MKLINLPTPLILLLTTTALATGLPSPKAKFEGISDSNPSIPGRAVPIRENKATQDRIDAFNFFATIKTSPQIPSQHLLSPEKISNHATQPDQEDMANKLIGGGSNFEYYSNLNLILDELSTLQYNIEHDPNYSHLSPTYRDLIKINELEKIVLPPAGRISWEGASREEMELWHPFEAFRRATFGEGIEECPATTVDIPFGMVISDIKEKVAKSVKECDEERKRVGSDQGKCLVEDALAEAGLSVEVMFEFQAERCLSAWDEKLKREEIEKEKANEEYYGGLDLGGLLALQDRISEEYKLESPAMQSQRAVKALEEIVKPPKGRDSWKEATRDEWQRWHPFTAARQIGISDGRMWGCPATTIIVPFGKTSSEVTKLVTDKMEECEKESAQGAKPYDGKCMYWDAAHELGFRTARLYGEEERKSCMVSFREWEKNRKVMEENKLVGVGIVEDFPDDMEL